ncbi:hypothetical protein DFH07DRAFT_968564 [Mycena maculata]|uniref:Uncharacterized protein n=1 Tax=Mycena maculata TaxID=230809 RepID=A0AAD7HZL3_9AGAR|nr:hypothetical protein DFH07DRAFT_968564 [Mycena maculata]
MRFHDEGRSRDSPRRGRSSQSVFTFARHAPAPALKSKQPYEFHDSLMHEAILVASREDDDPVYRGDVRPRFSCSRMHPLGSYELPESADDSSEDEDEDQLMDDAPIENGSVDDNRTDTETDTSTAGNAPSSPAARDWSPDTHTRAWSPGVETETGVAAKPETPLSFVELLKRASASSMEPPATSSRERLGSPFTPLVPTPLPTSDTYDALSPMTPLVPTRPPTPDTYGIPSAMSSFSSRASTPTPRPRVVVTYMGRNRAKAQRERAELEEKLAAVRHECAAARQAPPTRRSRRVRQGRIGDQSWPAGLTVEDVLVIGHEQHILDIE